MKRLAWLVGLSAIVGLGCGDGGETTTATTNTNTTNTGGSGGTSGAGGTGGAEPACGDGAVDSGETCDGNNLAGHTCEGQGFGPGTLSCSATCTLDTSQCAPPEGCGDGMISGIELCDGTELGTAQCTDVNYDGGTLACTANCQLDYSGCCSDGCPTAAATQCSGDVVQTCSVGASGCLEWQDTTDCTLTSEVCDATSTPAACIVPCTDDCPQANDLQCNGDVIEVCSAGTDGCLDWVSNTDCGLTGNTCEAASFTCQAPGLCTTPYDVTNATFPYQVIGTFDDDPTNGGSCDTTPTNAIWYSYTAPSTDTFLIDAQNITTTFAYSRLAVFESTNCTTLGNELSCVTASAKTINTSAALTQGMQYLILFHTDGNTYTMVDPSISITACTAVPAGTVVSTDPPNGGLTTSLAQPLTVNFDAPIDTNVGVVTITGTTTMLSYDLSTNPSEVSFSNGDQTMTISAGAFQPGESVTVTWTGIVDGQCGHPVTQPTWTFTVITPPCAPGQGGLVGTTTSTIPTGVTFSSEYYVAADENPTGWVYFGSTSALYRTPKAGGTTEDVEALAGLSTTNLGYGMFIGGQEIFTLESKTTGSTGHVWRISTDGGTNWNLEDYVSFPSPPNDDFRAGTVHNGVIYLITQDTASTEVWSVPAGGTAPQTATLVGTSTEASCSGIAVDNVNIYLACSTGDRLVRLPLSTAPTFTSELITDTYDLSATSNALYAVDTGSDGTADVLYFHGYTAETWYACSPASATPYLATLVSNSGHNYGLGFDPVANVLYAYDDNTYDLIAIQ